MEEEFSSEFNSELASSDEVILHFPGEDKSARKRNHSSPSKKNIKSSVSHVEPNISFSTSAEAQYLHTDGTVVARILKIVNNPEIMDGPDVYNQFNRTVCVQREENSGRIQLHIISNSLSHPVTDDVLMWLVELQTLIFQELPKISKSFVTRLVFDPKQRNLVLIKENSVVGGICFRMFPAKDFSEIAFLVVSSGQHAQGYGTHMLNNLKDYHIKHNIHNLLTYAAIEAVGYFEKQGFSNKITLDESVYEGYINFYENSMLMECQLDERITYIQLSEVISQQRMIVQKLIEEYQKSNIENSVERNASETYKKLKEL